MTSEHTVLQARLLPGSEDSARPSWPRIVCDHRGCSARIGDAFPYHRHWSYRARKRRADDDGLMLERVFPSRPPGWWISLAAGFVQDSTGLWALSRRAEHQWRLARRQR